MVKEDIRELVVVIVGVVDRVFGELEDVELDEVKDVSARVVVEVEVVIDVVTSVGPILLDAGLDVVLDVVLPGPIDEDVLDETEATPDDALVAEDEICVGVLVLSVVDVKAIEVVDTVEIGLVDIDVLRLVSDEDEEEERVEDSESVETLDTTLLVVIELLDRLLLASIGEIIEVKAVVVDVLVELSGVLEIEKEGIELVELPRLM